LKRDGYIQSLKAAFAIVTCSY